VWSTTPTPHPLKNTAPHNTAPETIAALRIPWPSRENVQSNLLNRSILRRIEKGLP
jgi:hypothetical protein